MEISKTYIEELKKKRAETPRGASERQELIQRLTDKINAERIGTKWKPATWGQINGLVRHLKEQDLYWLFSQCEKSDSFSKKFFGVLKS
ncbi:MAG: hypothetical protein A3C08_01615 [Candidatus Taylorbacteria bacterium RIFCSPHIGHO2_02_FULL_47_18]|uniref:Uncharacterized protein n=1 Tax=Candidatus Taylorbacteria bacterium RIFCSPLOWO2_01_FULL_48_100 TaxID=1802322 RepID=A0A1G2NFV6_9BACT|nr:MAG: hypothetical protein A2670_01375 [Candidatus Taylorbacteria bacterium RIFCSPHIGHO2_01_FULL_48_38]OHA28450.1 MAG: hypothetical protein A3C08_01615 [Candidatus Taylorbacteria bacterium RIFCSPHIGHO2_02_FULL_47_18]OHA34946.1 MAG: hypothetical protein A2938_02275 [Candidatus Taylorbacteria bacterium RIFCSPLOWO2_01_FULL_48_100]OHA40205.1 MAG: hypothetical protein A3J31_01325 [Candidatus Taylorbacteria bacterium RIFCSPLOWO2_02_FULL_48_16]OHA45461.1 MAG: hypothetical protein A3H13_01520 [Candid